MAPLTRSCESPGSGQGVGVASGAPTMVMEPVKGLQTESLTKLHGPASDLLRARVIEGAASVVKLLKLTYTRLVPSGYVSSSPTHWRSSITPGLGPQPSLSLTKLSPRSRETFI